MLWMIIGFAALVLCLLGAGFCFCVAIMIAKATMEEEEKNGKR